MLALLERNEDFSHSPALGGEIQVSIGCEPTNAGRASLALFPDLEVSLLAEELARAHGLTNNRWRLGDSYWLEIESTLKDKDMEGRP